MKNDLRILSVSNSPKFIEFLLRFRYEDVINCPKEKRREYRKKEKYTYKEQVILSVIGDTKRSWWLCPTVCSGRRGDGSSHRRKCRCFKGYGKNKESVWNFKNSQGFIYCSKSKSGKIETSKIVSPWCHRKRLAVEVARNLDLIYAFGSACLEKTLLQECLKCGYKTENGCSYKIGCGKGKSLFAYQCLVGICEGCKEQVIDKIERKNVRA